MRSSIPYVDEFIHLNSAAGSLADQSVYDAIVAHLDLEARFGNTEARLIVASDIECIYRLLSRLLNVPESRISVGASHTSCWQSAFWALPLGAGDRILVGETEWGGNLSAIWQRCRATGANMEVISSGGSGEVDASALEKLLDDRTRVVCITLAPAINGLVNPLNEIIRVLAGHPTWFFVDASQAFLNVETDFSNPRVDLATVSARKYLRAPRGTGFAVYSQRFLDTIDPIGLDQFSGPWTSREPTPLATARRYEFLETSFAVRMGFLAAVKVAVDRDVRADMLRIAELASQARQSLARLPGVSVQDRHDVLSGIVTFSHSRVAARNIQETLSRNGINVASPQKQYAPLWFSAGRPEVIRISAHAFNTASEIEMAVKAIAAL